MHRLPYTVPLPEGEYAKVISGEDWWGPMPDPFDPLFAEAADKMARNAAARFGGDPWVRRRQLQPLPPLDRRQSCRMDEVSCARQTRADRRIPFRLDRGLFWEGLVSF